jgi:hypothetical protein
MFHELDAPTVSANRLRVAYTFDSAEHQYMLVVSYDRQRWNEAGPTGKSLGECVQELLNGVSE